MRKSSLILLLVAAFVLSAAAIGFSADEPCMKICKNWNWDLHVSDTYQCTPGNQSTPGTCPSCPEFDFENMYNYCQTGQRYFVMKVCDCPKYDPSKPEWDANAKYGFRIEILEPQKGVYFTNVNYSNPGCAYVDSCSNTGTALIASVLNVSDIKDTKYCPNICTDGSPVQFSYVPVESGKALYDAVNPVEPCCLDCIGNLTTAIKTECALPIFQGKGGQPYVMLDLPSFVWDPKVISAGDTVKIKITLTSGEDDATICPSCKDLCSCVMDVAVFGCQTPKPSGNCQLCFPYFTSIDEAWWAGFAITNSGDSEATVNISFTAGDAGVAVVETIAPHSVLVKGLSEYDLSALAGKGGIYASVSGFETLPNGGTTAAALDGFGIMGDGTQAYGYLAKHGRCGCSSR